MKKPETYIEARNGKLYINGVAHCGVTSISFETDITSLVSDIIEWSNREVEPTKEEGKV